MEYLQIFGNDDISIEIQGAAIKQIVDMAWWHGSLQSTRSSEGDDLNNIAHYDNGVGARSLKGNLSAQQTFR